MKISITVSGGFVGLRRTVTLDSEELTPERARALARAADALAAAAPGPRRGSEPGYEIVLEDEGTTRSFSFSESNLPNEVRPLLGGGEFESG